MRPPAFFYCIVILLTTIPGSILCGEEAYWNQFRGPQANGASATARLPVEFGEGNNVLWKTPIHDKGWSSPVVWGSQVWVTTAPNDGSELYAVCVDLKTGAVVHDICVFEVAEPADIHPTNSYASSTPYVEEGRVYVHYGSAGTACLDTTTGEKLWERRDLLCDHFRGPASSPIVHGNLLFIQFDGIDLQYVVALDKRTGDTVWKTDRDIDYGTNENDWKKAYGTPTVIKAGAQEQLVCPSAMETIVYEPATGKEIWRVRHGGMNASARPIFQYGLVYISGGIGETSLVAVLPPGSGEITEPRIVWSTGKLVPQHASQVVDAGALYMVSDNGAASCLSARSGELFWTKRLAGDFWASPVCADGRLYFPNKAGKVFVLKTGPDFQLLAENRFDDGFNASPAIAGNSLILRSFTHLYRVGE